MGLRFVPYHEKYDASIQVLEQAAIQGKSIQLEIIKEHFLSRAAVYKKIYPCLGITDEDKVIATAIGAQTDLIINGHYDSDIGVCFDVKVHPLYRKKGIGKMMAKHIYKTFFATEGLIRNFITLKLSNIPVIRLVKAFRSISLYDFVYLTIPVTSRVPEPVALQGKKQLLSVSLFHSEDLSPSYYSDLPCGLAYFHTYQMYRLKIRHVHPLFKLGLRILKKVQPQKYAYLPGEEDILEFATLYNHTAKTIPYINEVLEQLERNNIHYLLVCCRKNDVIYQALKRQSINTYGYYIMADFTLKKEDEITIDVRCL